MTKKAFKNTPALVSRTAPRKSKTITQKKVGAGSPSNLATRASPDKKSVAGRASSRRDSTTRTGKKAPVPSASAIASQHLHGRYLVPFPVLKKAFDFQPGENGLLATIPYERLLETLKALLRVAGFDEDWYLARYPDVAQAVSDGTFPDAHTHFVDCGYFEGRFPTAVAVDEKWYLKENPDVALAIRSAKIESAAEHFYSLGYLEGRTPVYEP